MVLFNICCCCCCCLMLCASLCFWQISQLFQLMLLYSQFAFGILHMIHVSLVLDLARAVLEIAFKISSHITTEKHFSDQTTSCARRFVFVEAWHVFVRSSSRWTDLNSLLSYSGIIAGGNIIEDVMRLLQVHLWSWEVFDYRKHTCQSCESSSFCHLFFNRIIFKLLASL